MAYDDIRIERNRAVATVVVARPSKLNAMRDQTADELCAALAELEADSTIRAAVLTGEGRGFGAGYDLATVDVEGTPALDHVLDAHFNPLIRAMRRSRLPIVAALNGPCAGASIGVALAADVVIAARGAYLYEPFTGLALVPDAGNTLFLPRIAGRIRASAAMLLGERIPAEEARQWGLIWRVFDDDTLSAEALRIANALASRPPQAIAATKALIAQASEPDLASMLDAESVAQGAAGRGAELKEQVRAFFSR